MKPSEIIALARRQTGCTTDIVTIEEAYRFLNFIIEDFWAEIRLSDSWYWLKTWILPLVAWNNTYIYQSEAEWTEHSSPIFAMDKIIKVWILQSNWKYHEIPVRFVNEIEINKIESSGESNVCFFDWTKLIFAPTPATNWQAIIYGYNKNFEINKDTYDDESQIWIPSRWHHILIEWLKYRMYGNMWVGFDNSRKEARQFYDSEKLKAIAQLTDRGQMAEEWWEPDLNHLA